MRVSVIVAGLLALAGSGAAVWHATAAVFAGTSTTAATMTAGTVTLSDDTSGSAVFAWAAVAPGATVTRCVAVTYTGTLAADVRLYASASSGTLLGLLDLTIDQGTGGAFSSCTGFTAGSTLSTGTASGFAASSGWSTGLTAFTATPGATRTYRIVASLPDVPSSDVSGTTGTMTLTWEARST